MEIIPVSNTITGNKRLLYRINYKILAKLFFQTSANVRLLSYHPIPFMKYFLWLISLAIFISSCNPRTENKIQAKDSLQHLIQTLRDSIHENPTNRNYVFRLADELQNEGKYREAIQVLDSMNIQKEDSVNLPFYFDFLFKRSELLELAGDTTEAIKTLELFVVPGELTQAGLRLTNLYAQTKNPKTVSLCDAMKKNDKSGKDPNPDYLKGIYYSNTGDYEKALLQYDECILKDYNFLDAHMEKGRVLYKQKKINEALKAFELTLTLSNAYAEAFFWKAKCLEALGQMQEAKLNYQRAYGLDKTLIEAKEASERIIN
jgi:tetratricopeptide (TPR) repeat protein